MKKISFVVLAAILFSCNDKSTEGTISSTDSSGTTPARVSAVSYAYDIPKPDNWEIGSNENAAVALSALKAWEEGKYAEAGQYFADSITLNFDKMSTTVSNDSLVNIFASEAKISGPLKVRMSDWVSVVSKDKSDEWVTLWYTLTNQVNGKVDSVQLENDIKIKNGKIVRLDEYRRLLH